MSDAARPLPPVTPESAAYWKAGLDGVLLLGSCAECGRAHHPPQAVCPHCWAAASTTPASGAGHVEAFSVVHRSSSPAFAERLPYVVAYVRLDEGPALVANVVDCPVEEVEIGMAVRPVFEPLSESVALPLFRPAPRS